MNYTRNQIAALVACASFLVGPVAMADAVTDWNINSGEIVSDAKLLTPPASRTLAIVHTAMYEAANAITRRYPASGLKLEDTPGDSSDGGVVQGSSTAANEELTSPDAVDFPIALMEDNDSAIPAAVQGAYVPRVSLQLTIGEGAASRTLSASYEATYDHPASLAAAAGTYTGESGHVSGVNKATFTLDENGKLSGANPFCTFRGTVTPHRSVTALTRARSSSRPTGAGNGTRSRFLSLLLSIDRTGSLLRAATTAGLFEYQPTAQGAGIDLHQRGLTGSWYDPRTSGQGFLVQVYPDILSPGKGIVRASWLTYDNVVGGPNVSAGTHSAGR